MKVLFIGYWGAKEGLSVATIYPHLRILSSFEHIKEIYYVSIERDNIDVNINFNIPKLIHLPLYSGHTLKDKLKDFTSFPAELIRFVQTKSIDKIICRGAPAGALGYLIHKKTTVPYYVESFEPHADYMLEAGVWSKWNPKYILEKYWEKKQKDTAKGLMPVSNAYKNHLVEEGISMDKIHTIPCCVDLDTFNYKHEDHISIRSQLNISMDSVVGVYVGKFGGIYYEEEAFQLFKAFFEYYQERAYLIILTPQEELCQEYFTQYSIPTEQTKVGLVEHSDVPKYLSASNFAFSLHKPSPSKIGISPIKNGEYWANGLPIIIPDGIGDDSRIVREEKIGCVLDTKNHSIFEDLDHSFLNRSNQQRSSLSLVAKKYRSFEVSEEVYKLVYGM
ncbi:glycosyltransferase [Sediminitomix flava]|uniref:Glycosyltransferase involved in cell wall biosynthesis n=1 Tax=Sediminitomix flava TaxID=379075 RepID=A0A315ZDA2_SEDFL|nr:glycosyltransferase [Sediminitomix flava]PWJ43292.1 glycosyltransferase involved in cell wall biosynthesis [Sediminitomix flava]